MPGVNSNRHGVPAAVAFTKVVGFEPNGGCVGSMSYHELISLPTISMPAVHVSVVCSCTQTHTSVGGEPPVSAVVSLSEVAHDGRVAPESPGVTTCCKLPLESMMIAIGL